MEDERLFFHKKDNRNKTLEQEYARVVILDYVRKFSEGKKLYIPEYLNEELKLSDSAQVIGKLVRQKYLKRSGTDIVHLTAKAEAYLEDREDYIKFFNLAVPYVAINEYEAEKAAMKEKQSFEAIMITVLLKKIKCLKDEDRFEAVKNLHFDIATLYEQLNYQPQAMYHYLTALYYETSGLEHYDSFLRFIAKKSTAKEMERLYSYTCIDPQIIAGIKRMKDNYQDDMVDKIFEKNPISINLCVKEKYRELASDIVNGNYVNKDWQIYFWQTYKKLITKAKDITEKKNT